MAWELEEIRPIEAIPPDKFDGFRQFEFCASRASPWSRTVVETLPINPGLAYCLIMPEVMYGPLMEARELSDLDILFQLEGEDRSEEGLMRICERGCLSEGNKRLPLAVADRLIDLSGKHDSVYVRCWQSLNEEFVWRVPLRKYLRSDDLLNVLPSNFGDYQIADSENNWFIAICDDEPFILLAAPSKFVEGLAVDFPKWVLGVTGSAKFTS